LAINPSAIEVGSSTRGKEDVYPLKSSNLKLETEEREND
jgi:hypothetical protein